MENDRGHGKSWNSTYRSWDFLTEGYRNHFRNSGVKLKEYKKITPKTNV